MIFASIFSGWSADLSPLLSGLRVALELTGLSLLIGFPGGLLTALLVSSNRRLMRMLGLLIVEIGRGLPLLVLLYIVYQGLPQIHLSLTNFVSAVVAFAWSTAAYSSEMFRASLNALPKGQTEAALASGMNQVDTFRFVLLPQALRIAIPPLLNLAVQIFQATSLAYVITVPEIMQHAYFIGTVSFLYLNVFLLAGLLYAAVTLPSSALIARLERRLSRHTSV
ncbi:MAG: amino acid ABC transporter permease [Solirubrobacterales bacterium]|nr:amino acid ABC transporter permease [Solirubrobacterales bacterium]